MAVETTTGAAGTAGTTAPARGTAGEADRERENEVIDAALAGLDALDTPVAPPRPLAARAWSATWPKLGALAVFFLLWQVVVWTGWKPTYVLPGPGDAFSQLGGRIHTSEFWSSVGRTMQRAAVGYAVSLVVGTLVGIAVARIRIVRTAIGSFITALQTMPSIVWFPLAILLFQLNESAITFVVVLGAAPAIANGVISGIDYIPPLLVRVGRSMGARGPSLYRHVIVPAALPSFVAGMKQGWAFAWRSLMAGELLVVVPGHPSIGSTLENDRQVLDAPSVLADMIVIFVIGVIIDSFFTVLDKRLRQRRGLVEDAA